MLKRVSKKKFIYLDHVTSRYIYGIFYRCSHVLYINLNCDQDAKTIIFK